MAGTDQPVGALPRNGVGLRQTKKSQRSLLDFGVTPTQQRAWRDLRPKQTIPSAESPLIGHGANSGVMRFMRFITKNNII